MQIEIQQRPGSTIAKVDLAAGETVTAEGGAMVAMSPNFQVTTTTHQKSGSGGVLSGLKRMLASESLFLNHFSSPTEGTIYLGTTLPGDMQVFEMSGNKIFVQGGSYVASEAGVKLNTVWQGAKNFLSGETLFWIELTGQGKALINAFGIIYPIDIDGEYIVDTGHIVAYEEGLNYTLSKAGSSWISSILGGEGIVCIFNGKGRIWCQSHSSNSWGYSIAPFLKAIK